MVTHTFICDKCGKQICDTSAKGVHECPVCGNIMRWDMSGIGISKGDYYHVSESLGIIPEQTEEHRKYWPNVDVLPGGKLGFHSVKEQERYANHFGMDKKSQKIRR